MVKVKYEVGNYYIYEPNIHNYDIDNRFIYKVLRVTDYNVTFECVRQIGKDSHEVGQTDTIKFGMNLCRYSKPYNRYLVEKDVEDFLK